MGEVQVGQVVRYFAKVGVAAIEIHGGDLRIGDTIHIKGNTSDFSQTVESMEAEHEPIQTAVPGQLIGVKVRERVREDDIVYKEIP